MEFAIFSNFADQRLYRQDPGEQPRPITPLPQSGRADALRYADGVFDRSRRRMICVREDHTGGGEAVNALVGVDLAVAELPKILVAGNDFYSTPRLSPEGDRLAWLTWVHPDMPWVSTELWAGEILADGAIRNARRVAGGREELVVQPEWSPDGDLYFVSDRSGWWNLFRERHGAVEPMAPMDAEFARPQWAFGMSAYAFELAERRLICSFVKDGVWTLAQIDTRTKRFEAIRSEFADVSQLRARSGDAVLFGGTREQARALVDLDLSDRTPRVIRRSSVVPDSVRAHISLPEPIAFPTGGGETAHAIFYPPFFPAFAAPAGEKRRSRAQPRRADVVRVEHALARSPILDQSWYWRHRRELPRQHRLRPRLPAEARAAVGRRTDVADCVHGAKYLVENRNADPIAS